MPGVGLWGHHTPSRLGLAGLVSQRGPGDQCCFWACSAVSWSHLLKPSPLCSGSVCQGRGISKCPLFPLQEYILLTHPWRREGVNWKGSQGGWEGTEARNDMGPDRRQLPTSCLWPQQVQEGDMLILLLTQGPGGSQPPLSSSGVRAPHSPPFLTLASKKLLAPLTPSVDTSISERRASTCSPLSSSSSPAAALRKIRRNCGRENRTLTSSGREWEGPQPAHPRACYRPPWEERCSRAWEPEAWALHSPCSVFLNRLLGPSSLGLSCPSVKWEAR